jgi:hypothetical protein
VPGRTENRRNYYRILFLQPEAPPAVIRASWRALMHTQRGHPDLGGDHATAALINEAYAVLSDPEWRRAYDRLIDVTRLRTGTPTRPGDGGAARGAPPRQDPSAWRRACCCPMCRQALPAELRGDTRCGRCDAPLSPSPHPTATGRELFGRRATPRRTRGDDAALIVDWRRPGIGARLIDLSLGGAGLAAAVPVPAGTAVRVVTGALDAVAHVVACHRLQEHWRLRLQWLTARPLGTRGVYVSAVA